MRSLDETHAGSVDYNADWLIPNAPNIIKPARGAQRLNRDERWVACASRRCTDRPKSFTF